MTSQPPSEPPFSWEDFEGDFDKLRGTIVTSTPSWKKYTLLGAGAALVLAAGGTGWYYHAKTSPSEQDTLASDKAFTADLTRLYSEITNPTPSKQSLVVACSQALEMATSASTQSSDDSFEKYEAAILILEGLLRLKLEGYVDLESASDQELYETLLHKLGLMQVEYVTSTFKESVPLLQLAWIESRIQSLKSQGKKGASITKLEEAKIALEEEYSNTITEAALRLGSWLQYKNKTDLAERSFEIGRKNIEGYQIAGVFYPGSKPQKFGPLWSAYISTLENLASIAYQQKLYRQARSYIIRMFDTPHERTHKVQFYSWSQDNIDALRNQIKALKADVSLLAKATKRPAELPTHPLFSTEQTWVVDWTLLSSELRRSSFYSKKDPVAHTIWERLSPSLRSEILLKTDNSWLTEEHKHQIIDILNELVKNPNLRSLIVADKSISGVSKVTGLTTNYRTLSNNELYSVTSLNRRLLDQVIGSERYLEFFLHDGTPITQSLDMNQKRIYLRMLEEDYQEAKNTQDTQALKKLIDRLRNDSSPVTMLELKKYLEIKRRDVIAKSASLTKVHEAQSQHLKKIQKELEELESFNNINTTAIFELRQSEIAVKRSLLSKKFQKEQADIESQKLYKMINSLTKNFDIMLSQKERELATLVDRYNKQRSQSFEGNQTLLSSLTTLIRQHEGLRDKMLEVKAKEGNTSVESLKKELEETNSQIKGLQQKAAKASSDDNKSKLYNTIAHLEKKQAKLFSDLETLLDPIHSMIQAITDQEKTFVSKKSELDEIHKQIVALTGTVDKKGTLQKLSEERTNVLLAKVEADQSLEINQKIASINKRLQDAYAELSFLISRERSLRKSLNLFLPTFLKERPSINHSEMDKLASSLEKQTELFEAYQVVWREEEILDELEMQETLLIDSLEFLQQSLKDMKRLDANEVYDLNRAISTIIRSSNERERLKQSLVDISKTAYKLPASETNGYYLDAVKFAEYESTLGLDLNLYENIFSKRSTIVSELLSLIQEKNILERQKREAIQLQDQLLVDQISPKVLQVEERIQSLSQEEIQVNKTIQQHADNFLSKLHDAIDKRRELHMTELKARSRLGKIQRDLVKNDLDFFEVTEKLFSNLNQIKSTSSSVEVSTFLDIDELLKYQLDHLLRLNSLKNQIEQDNFYKSKALWLLAQTYYQQSMLAEYITYTDAQQIPEYMINDEKRHAQIAFENFEPEYTNFEQNFLRDAKAHKEALKDAKFNDWILFSQDTAIRIFQDLLPNYLANIRIQDFLSPGEDVFEYKEMLTFLTDSELITGKIYLNRAIKVLFPPADSDFKPEKTLAKRFLDKAERGFSDYLNLLNPKGHLPEQKDVNVSTSSFVELEKFQDQISEVQVLLSQVYFLRNDYQQSIEILRSFLARLLSKDPFFTQPANSSVIGEVTPQSASMYLYESGVDPFYASILSKNQYAQYALYQLALNYQTLAKRENYQSLSPDDEDYQKKFKRYHHYSEQAIAYFSQITEINLYSPLRALALYERAKIWRELGEYQAARTDLIRLLDTPKETEPIEMNNYFPMISGIKNAKAPSQNIINLELGKLYFDNQDYEAASEAFNDAAQGEVDHELVFEAKTAFANALFAQKRWVESIYIYQEILRERVDEGLGAYLKHGPDILINLGQAHLALEFFVVSYQAL